MIKDVARGVFRRCLPVLLALALTAAHGSAGVRRSAAGRPAAVSGHQHGGSADRPSDSTAEDNTTAAVVVADREQVLTQQNTVSIGVSRAPPTAAI
ncbi:hypothetical protein [Actinoplanes sp. L3-i22]|uniref:hypothetical protein n=1 Tax=Actinoplanes sp. L3-i22 TaxID=2836373 RepID=UPI001C852063|nr:hypothetical protein [Actinoplanes sp. L3-i22]